jgi:hypothetical protein
MGLAGLGSEQSGQCCDFVVSFTLAELNELFGKS